MFIDRFIDNDFKIKTLKKELVAGDATSSKDIDDIVYYTVRDYYFNFVYLFDLYILDRIYICFDLNHALFKSKVLRFI
ncbi:hypothetical protein CK594_06895 [Campylobacter coli]|nr:hypothetical protein [Campylobacter coli]EAI7228248.1 hypothetical protein [Campylobacter coli]QYH10518.1 hypothetical protein XJ49_000660 [Campylobacter coli]